MRPSRKISQTAFTLTEMMVSCVLIGIIGLAVFALMNAGMMLSARNFSMNLTNNSERNALDRAEQLIQQAYTMPTLVDTTGAATATTPAPGVTFDFYLGGPYVVTATAGTLPASTSSLTVTRTTNTVAVEPIPSIGDVLEFDSGTANIRARVTSVVTSAPDGLQHQAITVGLASSLGAVVSSPNSGTLTAHLIRKVALIVMPANSGYELRYYGSFETTANLNDPTKYVMLTKEIATQSGDATPFSITALQSANFVSLSLRTRSSAFDVRLANKQGGQQFDTFARIDSYIRPKINPQ
jgi:type II secretory pathway pseudopilin PulG